MAKPPPKLSAGIVVLRPHADGVRVLLLQALGRWEFPKGMVDDGEAPLDAALRECEEETGLAREKIELAFGESFTETTPYRGYGGRKVARFYLGLSAEGDVTLPINPQLGFAEHDAFEWVDFETAAARVHPRLQPTLRGAEARWNEAAGARRTGRDECMTDA